MRALTYIIILALFALSPFLSMRLNPRQYEGGHSRDVRERALRNSSAAAQMLGELRVTTSDILFLKTERYLHGGVAYSPHEDKVVGSLDAETAEVDAQAAGEDEHAHEEHEGHDHGHEEFHTLIPTKSGDFRGIIGDLNRVVKPWRGPGEPHLLVESSEILPWYRLMAYADPNNVRAYAIGGWWLKSANIVEAIRFVEEGRRNNPKAFQLAYMLGRLYFQKEQNEARKAGRELLATDRVKHAIQLYKEALELGFAIRPPGGIETDKAPWEDYKEEDLRAAARLAVILEREYGDPKEALSLAEDYNQRFESDGILQREMEMLTKAGVKAE